MSRLLGLVVACALATGAAPLQAGAGAPRAAGDLVGGTPWESYFPFRLGDSWTYDWKTTGPMAPGGTAVRTRAFDGTSFVNDAVGYKLVADDGGYDLYTFDHGVLSIHSSSEGGRLLYYDPPVVLASKELRVGEPLVVSHADTHRRWTTTLLGLETVSVPLGTFDQVLAIRLDMDGPDFRSSATHYFAPRVGLVAYRYTLDSATDHRRLLDVDARLRLARLSGVTVNRASDLEHLPSGDRGVVSEDRSIRELLKRALEKRYTWTGAFPGFKGDVEIVEGAKGPLRGSFVVSPDLSVRIDAADDASRAALRNEISSFITQRKDVPFDLAHAETTFVKAGTRPDGGVVISAAGDPLATTYVVRGDQIAEVSRSMGRISYSARDRSSLRTDDGRVISVEYDVVYTSNENHAEISVERTRDAYERVGGYWLPSARRVEKTAAGQAPTSREVRLTNVRLN